jgi:hypothetical protein
MPIVHSATEYTTQADGSLSVVERHTDHLGNKYQRVYFVPGGTDLEARATAYAAQLEQQLAYAEIDQLIDGFE